MNNAELARVFDDISRLLEVERDSPFKIRAYRAAARAIAAHPVELRDMLGQGGDLKDIPGIGEAIAKKTTELLTTGKLEFFEKLKQSTPAGVLELMQIPGIGPRTAALLATELGIASIDELADALRSGAVATLPGLGEKTARALLKEIEARQHRDT